MFSWAHKHNDSPRLQSPTAEELRKAKTFIIVSAREMGSYGELMVRNERI